MNFVIGIGIIVATVYALSISIGAFMGHATGEILDGAKVGAVIATIITLTFGGIVAGVLVMTA